MKKEGFFRHDALREEAAENEANRQKAPKRKAINKEIKIKVESCPEQSKQFF